MKDKEKVIVRAINIAMIIGAIGSVADAVYGVYRRRQFRKIEK